MKSVITKLESIETTLGLEKFEVEIQGKKSHNTVVEVRTDINTGHKVVFIATPIAGGLKPSQADAVARRLIDGARKYAGNHVTKASVVRTGFYAKPAS